MSIYQPLKKPSDGRWRYTVTNSQSTFELGYCSGWVNYTAQMLGFYGPKAQEEADRLNAKFAPFQDRFHSDGHTTAEEAVQCYRRYQLDHELRFSNKPDEETQHRCAVPDCRAWTQHSAWLAGDGIHETWHLCEKHLNREAVAGLYLGP